MNASALLLTASLSIGHPPEPPRVDAPALHSSRTGRSLALPRQEDAFHFVVFGDRTGGPISGLEVLRQAVSDTNLLDPDLVMTVGDLIEGYNETDAWLEEMRTYRKIMARLQAPWFPVAGNHDVYWRGSEPPPGQHEKNYEQHFGPLWYWFGHKNAAFVVLYSDEGDATTNEKGWGEARLNQMSDEQLAWLKDSLQETKAFDHVFVFLHHPRWISKNYPDSNWEAVHQRLRAAGNVTAVFAGHIHRRRFDGVRDGISYYTLGTTGGGIPIESTASTGWMHHFDVVTVRKEGISVATLGVGQVGDPREMTPQRLDQIDRLLLSELDVSTARPRVNGRGRGAGRARVVYTNPLSVPVRMTAELDATDPGWAFRPDHMHRTVAPGGTTTLEFFYRRRPVDAAVAPVELRLELEADIEGIAVRSPALRPVIDPVLSQRAPRSAGPDGCLVGMPDGGLRVAAADASLPDGPFTLEAWVRPDNLEGPRAIAGKPEWSGYGLLVRDGFVSWLVALGDAYSYTYVRSESKLPVGRWVHVAGVYDGRELRLYIDGTQVAQKPASGARKMNRVPFVIGADPNREGRLGDSFSGLIDGVRLSKSVRYTEARFTPQRRYRADRDAVLLFHFDRRIDSFVFDDTARRVQGYLVGPSKVRTESCQ